MLDRRKQSRRLGLGAGALGLSVFLLTLVALSLTWAWAPPQGASAPAGDGAWPFLLGGEVQAQTQSGVETGSIQGVARLQGRTSHLDITVDLDSAAQTTTDAAGSYAFDAVPPGTHVLKFSHQGYLTHGAVVFVGPGATATAPEVLLLGGDVAAPFGRIDLDDLRLIASRLGTADPQADANGDGNVDARDLTLAGRNFLRTATGPSSNMRVRLQALIDTIERGSPGEVEAAVDLAMEILYGGLRPLPSREVPATEEAHQVVLAAEMALAQALGRAVQRTDLPGGLRARLLNLKLFVEEMTEVAEAVGGITRQCGEDDTIADGNLDNPCNELAPILDEATGEEVLPGAIAPFPLRPSYSVKLRSPLVPQPITRRWEEDVQLLNVIAPDACHTVFKETRGLMLRLHFERIVVVRDPWVTVFSVPRGTRVPIWAMEWVPSEYIKQFHVCNQDGRVVTRVSQQVKQDTPLNFFWRYYR